MPLIHICNELTESGFVDQSIALIKRGIESGAKRENKSPETRITFHFGGYPTGDSTQMKVCALLCPKQSLILTKPGTPLGARR